MFLLSPGQGERLGEGAGAGSADGCMDTRNKSGRAARIGGRLNPVE